MDNCGNDIELRVIRTLSNVSGECGLVKCEVNVIELNNSGQYIDKYDNMEWDNGNSVAQVYDFSTPVYFFYQYNGIYGIDFSMDIVTYCGTFSYVFTPPEFNNVITVLGCDEDNCTSSFSYCEFYLESDDPILEEWKMYGGNGQMPKLYSIKYIDPIGGIQTLDASNNGIFHFPYYGRVANDCGFHPNLFDFVNDMNKYLIQSGIGGVCEFYYTDLPNYCKRYVRYLNTRVFFLEMICDVENFYYEIAPIPVCGFPPSSKDKIVAISPDFPVSTACLPGNLISEDLDNDEILMKIDMLSRGVSTNVNNKNESVIYCYPNITDTDLFIDNRNKGEYKVNIYSLSGEIIKQFEVDKNNMKVNISDCKPGMYFIRFYNQESGNIKTDKIIIQ